MRFLEALGSLGTLRAQGALGAWGPWGALGGWGVVVPLCGGRVGGGCPKCNTSRHWWLKTHLWALKNGKI